MPVSYLATKSQSPFSNDMNHLQLVLNCLAGTQDKNIVFKRTAIDPSIYTDASHGIHSDGKGQGGIMIRLGDALIYAKSFKLVLETRRS
jgi:hypothetical protein